jgi:hypothetical protein
MPAAGTVIHALGPKLQVIWTCLHRAGVLDKPNLRGLAEAANINLQTLKSSRSKGSLTDEIALKLSKFAGFDHRDARWHDSNVAVSLRSLPDRSYPGRDTVAAFRSLMHRVLELGGTNVQLSTVGLQHLDTRLAKFQLDASGQHFDEGEAAELLMTVNLESSEEGGVRFGFRRVRVEMTFPGAQRVAVENRLGHKAPYAVRDAALTALGGSLNPEWHLTSNDAFLGGEYATREVGLGSLTHLNVGDQIVARLSAKIRDGDLHIVSEDDNLSADQEAVIRALFEQSIAGVKDRGGWLTLALQNLEVQRGDD